jgi:ferredoxin
VHDAGPRERTHRAGSGGAGERCVSSRLVTTVTQSETASAAAEICDVRFEPSALVARVPSGTTLLEAARSVGLPVASACGADGVCARCGMQILAGAESLGAETEREVTIKQRNRIDAELRLACRVRITAPLTATASYWG